MLGALDSCSGGLGGRCRRRAETDPSDGSRWMTDGRARGPAHPRPQSRTIQARSGSAGGRARGKRGCPSRDRASGTRRLPYSSPRLGVGMPACRRTSLACLRPPNAKLSCRRSAVQPSERLALEFTRQALNRNASSAGQLQRWVSERISMGALAPVGCTQERSARRPLAPTRRRAGGAYR